MTKMDGDTQRHTMGTDSGNGNENRKNGLRYNKGQDKFLQRNELDGKRRRTETETERPAEGPHGPVGWLLGCWLLTAGWLAVGGRERERDRETEKAEQAGAVNVKQV
jgi:hypothetical protein